MSLIQPLGAIKTKILRAVAVMAPSVFAVYLGSRLTVTIQGAQPLLATVLILTEVVVLVELVAEIYRRWPSSAANGPHRSPLTSGNPSKSSIGGQDITVVIPVDDERADFVRISALTAAELGPAAIILACAEGRPDIDALANRLDGVYVYNLSDGPTIRGARSRRVRLVNSLIPFVETTWMMVLTPGDAPHHMTPQYLRVAESTGVVTMGRRISDTNSFEVGADLSWERRLDQDVDQPSLTARGLQEWRDFPAIIRVEAIRQIRGLAEDEKAFLRASGRLLQRFGWTIQSGPSDLIVGPGTVDIGGKMAEIYLDRRAAIAASRYWVDEPGLSRRVMDLVAYVPIVTSVRQLAQAMLVAVVLITGLVPAVMSPTQIVTWVVPAYGMRWLARWTLKRRMAPWWKVYLSESRSMSASLALIPDLLGRDIRVRRSGGGRRVDRGGTYGLKVLPTQLLATLILDLAVLVAAFGTFFDLPVGAKGLLFTVFVPIAVFKIAGLSSVIVNAATRRQMRNQSRLMVRFDLTIDGHPGRAVDITSRGIGLATHLTLEPGDETWLGMDIDGYGEIGLRGRVTHAEPLAGTDGLQTVGLELLENQEHDVDRLYRFCGGTWSFQRLAELDPGNQRERVEVATPAR